MTKEKRMAANEVATKHKNRKDYTKPRTQKQVVLQELKDRPDGITSIDMFQRHWITRLSAHIFMLRHEGYDIDTVMVESKSGKRYGKYILRNN